MSTETAPRTWLGLGSAGWALYVVIALTNAFIMVSVADTVQDKAMYAVGTFLLAYGVIRFWKFVAGLFFRVVN